MIEICTDHTGKMEGINSISTSVVLNPNCQTNRKVRGSICRHCYAQNMADMYSGLAARLERNTKTLTERLIPEEELPDTTGQSIFRFESFGDLNNEIQLANYMAIVRKNPGTRFTLWTKMYNLAYSYFSEHDVPDNFTLILSSLLVNVKIDLGRFKALGKFAPGQLKSFTVYDAAYLRGYPNQEINCGSRCCVKCRRCYERNRIEEISEILKSDQAEANRMLGLRDPDNMDMVGGMIDALDI